MPSVPTRRQFLQSTAAAAAGVTIVPRHVRGGTGFQAPSDTFNVAGVGVGGGNYGELLPSKYGKTPRPRTRTTNRPNCWNDGRGIFPSG